MASPIKTVVLLVQQNRSFDHMMGWMKFLNREINGVTGSESNPLSTSRPKANRVHFNNQAGCLEADNYPSHSFEAVYEQVFGVPWSSESSGSNKFVPTMQGFVQQAERTGEGTSKAVMNGLKPDAIPVYKEVVAEFAVCDWWFSSVPASDQPNRLYIHSATSHGSTSNDVEMVIGGYPQKTIFDSLDEAGFTFGIYYQLAPTTTLLYRNLRKLKYMKNFHQFDLEFKKNCEEGKLPNYVVIEQRYFETKLLPGNDDHPSHDVSEGQKFVKHVYEALRSSPQWNEILFIIVYDEHGGFYDHVPTPVAGVPSPDGIVGPEPFKFQFDRLGVRVPAILVSPWIERGTVLHRPRGPYPTSEFEHSSIPATLKKIFNLKEFLTKRDEWAGTLEVALNRSSPRTDCPVTLPEPVKLRDLEPVEQKKLSDFQQELVQLAAALNGDHRKDIFPNKLVDDMTVIEAVNYVEGAFRVFLDECDKAKNSGAEESHIASIPSPNPRSRPPKTFAQKLFSCLICDN